MKRSFWAVMAVAATLAGSAGSAAASNSSAPSGEITTIAGGLGGPGPATAVSLDQAPGCYGMQVSGGQLYLNGAGVERAIDVRTGTLKNVAVQLLPSFSSGQGGPSELAERPLCSATVDSFGNLVVADQGLKVIAAKPGTFYGLKMTAGHAYSLIHGANCGPFEGSLACVVDVVTDRSGNLVVSLSAAQGRTLTPATIKVEPARSGTYYGQAMKVGHAYSLKTGGGAQLAVDHSGNLVVAGDQTNQIAVLAERAGRFYGRKMTAGKLYEIAGAKAGGYSGDGGPAGKARLSGPKGVAVDQAGNIVIGDTGNNVVRVLAERAGRFYGRAMKAGDIYTVVQGTQPVAQALSIAAVAVDGAGNILTLGAGNPNGFFGTDTSLVRVFAAKSGRFYGQQMKAGHLYVVAGVAHGPPGDGGPATKAQFQFMGGMTVDGAGNIVQTDTFQVRVVARSSGSFYGMAMTAGDIYTVAGNGNPVFNGDGDGGPALKAPMEPRDVAVDGLGNLLIVGNNRVRVVPASTGTFYGQAMKAGHIYTVAGTGEEGFSGDEGPAVDAAVDAAAMTVDPAGNLVIADFSDRIRVVAATTGTFYGRPMTAGDIYTVAGEGLNSGSTADGVPAVQANIAAPQGLTTDGNGNLVITVNFTIKQVRVIAVSTGTFYGQPMTAGDIYTIAGEGDANGSGGPSAEIRLTSPMAVAVDGAGNVAIADEFHNHGLVWVVADRTGTFYGQSMTAGDIYAVAGGASHGLGDGGPGTEAEVDPYWIAETPGGDLAITDAGNGRIRLLTH